MSQTEKDVKTSPKVARPKQYVVVFLNDDFTPMEFVVWVFQQFFHKSLEEAEQLTLKIHKDGKATVGPFTHEIAETRVMLVAQHARQYEFPFKCDVAEE